MVEATTIALAALVGWLAYLLSKASKCDCGATQSPTQAKRKAPIIIEPEEEKRSVAQILEAETEETMEESGLFPLEQGKHL